MASWLRGLLSISKKCENDHTLDALNEVLGAYQQVMEDEVSAMNNQKSFDTEGAYESAFREVISKRTLIAAKLAADDRTAEGRLLKTEPAVSAETEPAGKQPARAVAVTTKSAPEVKIRKRSVAASAMQQV